VTLKYDDQTLVSFITPASACPDSAASQVTHKLPYYCSPALILPMEELPRTPRGKLDKRRLSEMARQHFSDRRAETAR